MSGKGLILPNGAEAIQVQTINVQLGKPSDPEKPDVLDGMLRVQLPVPTTAPEVVQDTIAKLLTHILVELVDARMERTHRVGELIAEAMAQQQQQPTHRPDRGRIHPVPR